eukprot:gene9785-12006_t
MRTLDAQGIKLAEELGASTAVLTGSDAAQALVSQAQTLNCATLVVGRPALSGWRTWGTHSMTRRLALLAPTLDIVEVGRAESARRLALAARRTEEEAPDAAWHDSVPRYAWAAGSSVAITLLALPLLRFFEFVTEMLVKLLGLRVRSAADNVSEDEVRALVEQGLHAGVFQRAEKEMVEGVLALDQLPVTRLMTPRPKIVFLNLDDPEEANWRKIVTSGHSYFPVYQTQRDTIVGM